MLNESSVSYSGGKKFLHEVQTVALQHAENTALDSSIFMEEGCGKKQLFYHLKSITFWFG